MSDIKTIIRDTALRVYPGETRGDWVTYSGPCPFCSREKKFGWNLTTCGYKCHGCAETGNLYNLLEDDIPKDQLTRRELDDAKTIEEKLADRYRRETGKNWRLDMATISHFGIKYAPAAPGEKYGYLHLPGPDGGMAKRLMKPRGAKKQIWSNVPGYPGQVLLNGNRVKPDGLIVFVEGEWDLFAAWKNWGLDAVYITGGANSIGMHTDTTALLACLTSRHDIVILFDRDQAGASGARNLATKIYTGHNVKSVRVMDWSFLAQPVPGIAKAAAGVDLEDAIRAGLTFQRFSEIVEKTPLFKPGAVTEYPKAINGNDLLAPVPKDMAKPPREYRRLAFVWDELWSMRRLPDYERFHQLCKLAREYRVEMLDIMPVAHAGKEDISEIDIATWLDEKLKNNLASVVMRHMILADMKKSAIKQEYGKGKNDESIFWKFNGQYYMKLNESDKLSFAEAILDEMPFTNDKISTRNSMRTAIKAEIAGQLASCESAEIINHIEPYHLNLQDGVLDTRNMTLSEHSPKYFFQGVSNAYWANSAHGCPAWIKFWDNALGPEQAREMWKFVYTVLAVYPRPKPAAFFIGQGGSGKTWSSRMISALVGEYNTSAVSIPDLDRPFASYNLCGKTLNIWEEGGHGGYMKEEIFKKITGSGFIQVEKKHGGSWPILSMAQWLITSNNVPTTSDFSIAFLRRLAIFNFWPHNPFEKNDRYLQDTLLPQAAGALRHALTYGREEYERDGCTLQDVTQNPVFGFLREGDSVAAYWADRINNAPPKKSGFGVSADDSNFMNFWQRSHDRPGFVFHLNDKQYFPEYKKYATDNGMIPVSSRIFAARTENFWQNEMDNNRFKRENWTQVKITKTQQFRPLDEAKPVYGMRMEVGGLVPLDDLLNFTGIATAIADDTEIPI